MISLNKLPPELGFHVLKCLPTRSLLLHSILSCRAMSTAFDEYRTPILQHVYSTEISSICTYSGVAVAIARARDTLRTTKISKDMDRALLGFSAWRTLIFDSVTITLLPLAHDIASLCEKTGRAEKGLVVLERAWEMSRGRVALYEKTGRAEEALAVLERTLEMSRGGVLLQLLAQARDLAAFYEKTGRAEEALAVLERAWETSRGGVTLQLLPLARDLAALYEKTGLTEEALVALGQAGLPFKPSLPSA